ncbi:hypothetical protein [Rhodococcus globerulus]|uniref:hypothetical protein n=1 Tax=Rhodococcus globerulus TaxID=33008 RepID=UPI003019F757
MAFESQVTKLGVARSQHDEYLVDRIPLFESSLTAAARRSCGTSPSAQLTRYEEDLCTVQYSVSGSIVNRLSILWSLGAAPAVASDGDTELAVTARAVQVTLCVLVIIFVLSPILAHLLRGPTFHDDVSRIAVSRKS